MRAIVLTNGEIEDPEVLRARLAPQDGDVVIAADGGCLLARALGLVPDVVVGDLDSLDPETARALKGGGTQVIGVSPQKDETDLELALLQAVERGAQKLVVLGAIGGRLDMTLANILLLAHPRLSSVEVELWHGRQIARLIRAPGGVIHGSVGDTLSLLPLNGDVVGVSTQGLHYALRSETLAAGPARGVSNVFTQDVARIRLRSGLLLAVHTPGRA